MKTRTLVAVSIGAFVLAVGGYAALESQKEAALLKERRDLVTGRLKDPSSVQFRSESFKNDWLCGELNAKNSYGAYSGFKRFLVKDSSAAYIEAIGSVGSDDISRSNYFSEVRLTALKMQNARLAERNAYMRENHKEPAAMPQISDEDAYDHAQEEVFDNLWRERCI